MRIQRRRLLQVAVVGTAAVGVAGGGALLSRPESDVDTPAPARAGSGIAALRQRVARLPDDWTAWAALGMALLEQARSTGDPGGYPEAERALRRSLEVRPKGNAAAATGLGVLAAARHDFGAALDWGREAVAADAYSAPAQGVIADALVELGRYEQAWPAVQRMVDLRPDTGSLARASYTWQLRGETARALTLMGQARTLAPDGGQAAFTATHLAELAFDTGDLATAARHVADGLRQAPGYPPLRAAEARVAAARGDTAGAARTWTALVARIPQPGFLAEYGDLLAATGDAAGARGQYDTVRAAARLQAARGVDVDLELALFLADRGEAGPALSMARATYARRPSIAAADALAWALHAAGERREAMSRADEALRLGTRSPAMLYHRGMIAAADPAHARRARADLDAALRLNPRFSPWHAPRARATLARLAAA